MAVLRVSSTGITVDSTAITADATIAPGDGSYTLEWIAPLPIPFTAEWAAPLPVPFTAEWQAPLPIRYITEWAAPLPIPYTAEWVAPLPIPFTVEWTAPLTFPTPYTAEWIAPLPLGKFAAEWAAPLPVPYTLEWQAPLPIPEKFTAEWQAPLPLGKFTAEWEAPLPVPFTAEWTAPLPIPEKYTAEWVAPLPLGRFTAEWQAPLPIPYTLEWQAPLPIPVKFTAEWTAPLPIGGYTAEWQAPLPIPYTAEWVAPLPIPVPYTAEWIAPLPIPDWYTLEWAAPLPIPSQPKYVFEWTAPLPITIPTETLVTGQLRVLIPGHASLPVVSANVEASEGSSYWQADITLARASDTGLLPLDAAITLDMFGTEYTLVVRGRTVAHSMDADGNQIPVGKITGLSPAYLLSSDVAQGITRTWATVVSARAAVEDVLGQTVDWQIDDWTLPAYRLAALDQAPLDIATRIVAAAGALLESNPDGTLYARHAWPVPATQLATATPDHTLPAHKLLSSDEQATRQQRINRVRVVDVDVGYADQIEYTADEDDGLKGIVKAWPSPWREIRIIHTRGTPPVRLYPDSIQSEQLTETVEFVAGRGAVRYPLHTLGAVVWLADDLGGITTAAGSRELVSDTENGYSLAMVTYTTRYYQYRAESLIETDAQLLIEDISRG